MEAPCTVETNIAQTCAFPVAENAQALFKSCPSQNQTRQRWLMIISDQFTPCVSYIVRIIDNHLSI